MEEFRLALREERQLLQSMAKESLDNWTQSLQITFERLEGELQPLESNKSKPFDLDFEQKAVACLRDDVDPLPPGEPQTVSPGRLHPTWVTTTTSYDSPSPVELAPDNGRNPTESNGVRCSEVSQASGATMSPELTTAEVTTEFPATEAAASSSGLQRAPSRGTPGMAPPSPSVKTGLGQSAMQVLGELAHLQNPSTSTNAKALRGSSDSGKAKINSELYEAAINYTAGILVLLNSMLMLLELEIEGGAIGKELGMRTDSAKLSDWQPVFRFLDGCFVFIFLFELLIRIGLERRKVLHDIAFWFDAFLVIAGLFDMFVILPMIQSDGFGGEPKNIVLLRLVRALKAFRAMRMVRTLRLFKGLRLLVKACQCFLPSLGWAMVLLTVFMSMSALILATLLQDFISNPVNHLEDREWVWMRYGTAYHALYTLYEITFAGNWPTNVRPVLEKVSHLYVLFFVIYITIIVFAVIRVISAIFLKDTLDAANNDAEQAVVEQLQKKKQYVEKLEAIFNAMDKTQDGMITEERLSEMLSNPVVLTYFQTLDIDVHESAALFHLMDNGDGEVTLEEFVGGIMRCKGQARAIDQVAMRADLKTLDTKISKISRALRHAGIVPKTPMAKGRRKETKETVLDT